MSGGSHNYLCWKQNEEFLTSEEDIENMIFALKAWNQNGDPAVEKMIFETEEFLRNVRRIKREIELLEVSEKLRRAWRGMEWGESLDGWERFIDAIEEYGDD